MIKKEEAIKFFEKKYNAKWEKVELGDEHFIRIEWADKEIYYSFSVYINLDKNYEFEFDSVFQFTKVSFEFIEDLLSNGYDVILDRYVESNMAPQGGKIFDKDERLKLYDWLYTLEYGLMELPKPEITIFLHMPCEKAVELRKGRAEAPDQHESSLLHLRNAEQAYLELANLHNYYTIECLDKNGKLRDIEDIQEDVYNEVCKVLKIEHKD